MHSFLSLTSNRMTVPSSLVDTALGMQKAGFSNELGNMCVFPYNDSQNVRKVFSKSAKWILEYNLATEALSNFSLCFDIDLLRILLILCKMKYIFLRYKIRLIFGLVFQWRKGDFDGFFTFSSSCMWALQNVHRQTRTTCRSSYVQPPCGNPGTGLWASGLVANAFTHRAKILSPGSLIINYTS